LLSHNLTGLTGTRDYSFIHSQNLKKETKHFLCFETMPPLNQSYESMHTSDNISFQVQQPPKFFEKKRVLFSDKVEVHEIPHRSDYSKEEASNIWFTLEDRARILTENRKVCFALLEGGAISLDEDECIRGLECCLPDADMARMITIKFALFVVLRAQAKFRRQGKANENGLSSLYRRATLEEKESARLRGLEDS
jgi:hypothetical protein